MKATDLKKQIVHEVKRLGPKTVRIALISHGVGLSTAEKLTAGTYGPNPRGDIAWGIEQALVELKKKDLAS